MTQRSHHNDLTRWNRSNQSRFRYVDGNAAVFLEHLRGAMISRFMRGVPAGAAGRQPEFWFKLFSSEAFKGEDPATMVEYLEALDWSALAEGLPEALERTSSRNQRLVRNYHAVSDDYAAETMRAFARASHVMAGYIDAYMNESYMGTATQWDSLHKLGQMVNYAPAPAASAMGTVALAIKPEAGVVEIAAGLAMSAPPTSGGAPLIFETLTDITAHSDLNETHERRWNVNRTVLDLTVANTWLLEGEDAPAPGALVLLAPSKFNEPGVRAALVARARLVAEGSMASITLETDPGGIWRKGYAQLLCHPEAAVKGLPISDERGVVVRAEKAGQMKAGAVIEAKLTDNSIHQVIIRQIQGDRVRLGIEGVDVASIRQMVQYPVENNYVVTANLQPVYTNVAGDLRVLLGVNSPDGSRFTYAAYGASWAGIKDNFAGWDEVDALTRPPQISSQFHEPNSIVTFAGKPAKSLKEGQYFVARNPDDSLIGLKVRGVRADKTEYHIAFNRPLTAAPEDTVFHGPFKTVLRPQDYDRSTETLGGGDSWLTLAGLSEDAKALLRIGKRFIIQDKREMGLSPILATVVEVDKVSGNGGDRSEHDQARIRFDSVRSDFDDFVLGWTVFRFNTLDIGHGETKAGKTLGSGNAELPRQSLPLDVKSISFLADDKAATGVRPDIDVRVDGTLWDYADLSDISAENTNSYSIRPHDDDTLNIEFRRRLPSGKNNIRVSRHRVGAGAAGNNIGPLAFTKPKSKHKFIEKIYQPFATSGGGDRETTDSIRENAGAAIAANDRAVALEDFTRLVKRHAAVWDARAHQALGPGRAPLVRINVVPVDGAPLQGVLADSLTTYIKARAVPGVLLEIIDFTRLNFEIAAKIRVDTAQYPKDVMLEMATKTLATVFSLQRRSLGQHLYLTEIMATLEAIAGVQTANVTLAAKAGTVLAPGQVFSSASGTLRAVYPRAGEVGFVDSLNDITIEIEPVL